jgi:hypothetical protein
MPKATRLASLLVVAFVLDGIGCMPITRPPVDALSTGASKADAVALLGMPDRSWVAGNTETLAWEWDKISWMLAGERGGEWVSVQLVDGKVVAYGDRPLTEAELKARAQVQVASEIGRGLALQGALIRPTQVNVTQHQEQW